MACSLVSPRDFGPVADCVDIFSAVLPESQEWPAFDGNVFGSSLGYDAGIFLSRHFWSS